MNKRDADPAERARAAALRLISIRPRSEAEVCARLRRRFSHALVETVVETLREQSLLDDASFALQWKDSRESNNPRSAWAVQRELLAKGVEKGLAESAVQDIDDEESAYRAGLKHAPRVHRGADPVTFKRKMWGYLKRRGFGDAVCRHTISRLWSEM